MNNRTIQFITILGTLAIVGIIVVQSYWVWQTWHLNDGDFNQRVTLALASASRDMAELQGVELPTQDIIHRQASNYYIVNIDNDINASTLEYFLRKELETVGLSLDFEYAIYDCFTDRMVDGAYVSYGQGDMPSEPAALPKSDKFIYYFGVRFPTRSAYLAGRMTLSIVFTCILLVAVAFFGYAMAIILRQRRLSELQKDFINNMTHEFKTPISTIGIAAQTFVQHPDIKANERLLRYANVIKEQSARLNSQVEKVLQIAQLERSTFKINPVWLDLGQVLAEAAESCRVKMQGREGEVKIQVPEEPIIVFADPLHLGNVLHNLLDNAVKYCEGVPRIVVGAYWQGKGAEFFVKDNGIGIPREYQQKVFSKFFRVPTGNVHNVKGFGLGLFYIHTVVEAHDWSLRLSSEPGRGTTVCIYTPSAKKAVPL